MRRKVLLFNPESEFYAMPLGLLAVGSALDPVKYDVRIFDARIESKAASKVMDEAEEAACVGITVFSGAPIASALKLSRQLKNRFRDLPIVWGGWHPSILPEQCVASGAVDAVIIGQGSLSGFAPYEEYAGAVREELKPARAAKPRGRRVARDARAARSATRV